MTTDRDYSLVANLHPKIAKGSTDCTLTSVEDKEYAESVTGEYGEDGGLLNAA